MKILKTFKELSQYFETLDSPLRCLADTGFLYALAYEDDRLFEQANELLDLLSEKNASIYVNVISRLEFIDLIFRKQVTLGCIQLLESLGRNAFEKPIFNILKNIRDSDTAAKKKGQSYKIDESRLKLLRREIQRINGITGWKDFCQMYVGLMLVNEWKILEEDLGLNFVEIMDGEVSDLFHAPLRWEEMAQVMGDNGLRGPDAMIFNLFNKSKFPLLITSDSDFESLALDGVAPFFSKKALLHLS
jgi:predicted nucleic acid-binding protein